MNLWMAPFAMLQQAAPGPSLLDRLTLVNILSAATLLLIVWLLIRLIEKLLDLLSSRASRARFFFKRLGPVTRITLWIVAALAIVDIFAGENQTTFFAGIASIGIALGLGAQDLIKNVVGGLVVLTDRPYQLGDRVKIGDAYGEIDHIGLRSTKLTTPDDTRVTIPNADILTCHVYNANSGVPDCQVVTDLFLPHDTDPDLAIRVGNEVAYTSPYILLSKPVAVLVADCYDQQPYLRLRVKAYVYDHRLEPRLQSDVTARAKREFLKLGILQRWKGQEGGAEGASEEESPVSDPR
ncbi:MAG: mechanosensitive ion channel family protein [Bryobacterales bacterium]